MNANTVWLGLELKAWLGLTVLGAVVAAIGSIVGIVVKDYFFSRSIERFKQRQALEAVYQKYRDPLLLAACDMVSRLVEILDHYPTVYLRSAVFASQPERQIKNSIEDPYFQKYKLVSTLYRISALLAWLELYRQELTFLHPGDSQKSRQLEVAVHSIRSDLADGQLNEAHDWHDWRDTLIFREELRAVGESLIEARGTVRSVMGYGQYCELLESTTPNHVSRWGKVLLNFLMDLEVDAKDFRRIRLERLLSHLVQLLELLGPSSIEPYMRDATRRHRTWCRSAA